ncbi:metallophosphoesterase [Bacillus sp. FJAT-47783]|uniref:metallophosphoesterase n=1 Tax=Bacillus sp. FJAT-47783 TaxID=2922712 RepID=UPI001FAB5B68|nr:metallophosphoesterase [Bacillus sp. FJAT-47783]
MKGTLSRRQFLKRLSAALLAGVGISFGGYSYIRFIEPKRLSVTKKQIKHRFIPKSFHQKTIVQFSDTHLSDYFKIEQLERVVNTINSFNPDVIVFTGDLIDEPNRYNRLNDIVPVLQDLSAPLGKYAIYGNHDHGGYGTDIYKNIMERSNFELLQNKSKKIQLEDGSFIYMAGLDDLMLGKPDWDKTFHKMAENTYTILLAHEPDAANRTKHYPVHLQLSGHSHGGQIKLPFIGPLYTPPFSNDYHEGFYEVGSTTLYVNRGLGTTRLPFRFLSVPEITVFTLISNEETENL